ncbi:MAG: ABC transporter permease [Bacteroidales bacterium]|nr:ABC transporter permease [Bacteroidales bacterium]
MRFLSLSKRNFKELFRDPVTVLLGIALPLVMVLLFASIYERTRFHVFSPTELAPVVNIFSFTFLLMFSATLLAKDKQSAFLLRLLTTPLKPLDFILAYLLPFLALSLLMIASCLLTGYAIGANYANIPGILLILFLVGITCIGLGLILGSFFTVSQVSGVGSIIITAASLFGNIWTPLEMMGGVFKTVGYAMPFAHAADALRFMVYGGRLLDVSEHLIWVLAYAVIFIVGGVFAFKWSTRPK